MIRRVFLCFLLISSFAFAENEKLAFIYYYAWYANPDSNGEWLHWQDYNHKPPQDISSSYYPRLGAYSSVDSMVLEQHIRWIAGSNINVIIYSWWGRGDYTDQAAKPLLDLAVDYGLKVVFLIEPYDGRNPKNICDDIEYLYDRFANHPAFLKLSYKTQFSPDPGRRSMFLIYQPDYPEEELKQLADKIHQSNHDCLILLQSTDTDLVERTHSDGMFAYEAYQNLQHFYPGLVESAKTKHILFIPCVSPGFNVNRTFGERSDVFRPRRYGKTYDDWWEKVLAADAEYVSIISFNEWHEGTQIEPSVTVPGYLSYRGAYGKQDHASEESFLRRTARWIALFQHR